MELVTNPEVNALTFEQSAHMIFTGFDIETRPMPDLVDKFTKPFPAFDRDAVKCGNLKDPVKIAEKLAQAEADHKTDELRYWEKAHMDAALNPFTAEIVVIGLIDEQGFTAYLHGPEPAILGGFWKAFTLGGDAARKFVFWSGCGAIESKFDIDFIMTRSRICGVKIPPQARDGRYYSRRIVDLAGEFLLHKRESYLSLTKAAQLFNLYGADGLCGPEGVPADQTIFPKRDDDPVTGKNFFLWWDGIAVADHSAEEQRALATRYLANDLKHLLHLAPRIL